VITKERFEMWLGNLAKMDGRYAKLQEMYAKANETQRTCWFEHNIEPKAPESLSDLLQVLEWVSPRVYNWNDEERQKIIKTYGVLFDRASLRNPAPAEGFIKDYDLLYYAGLTASGLELLIEKGFADPEERQNSAPSIKEFLEFLKAHPRFGAHGYIVTPERGDYRVSVEGVSATGCDAKDIVAFTNEYSHADEFSIDECEDGEGFSCRCWYD